MHTTSEFKFPRYNFGELILFGMIATQLWRHNAVFSRRAGSVDPNKHWVIYRLLCISEEH